MTVQPPEQPLNPDCAQRKHQACAGDAWDDDADELTACACACACHVVPRDLPCQHPALITITGRPGWLECVTCGQTLPDPKERP